MSMNKYTQLNVIEDLVKAETVIAARGGINYDKPLTVSEYVAIKIALENALRLLRKDLLERVAN